jgi:anthranilate phosphoribosyltransferase
MFEISPEDFGLTTQELDGLRGGDPDCNATIVRSVLDGSRKDQARALVVMNAAAALVVGDVVSDLREGSQLANNVIDDGAALRKLDELARITSA